MYIHALKNDVLSLLFTGIYCDIDSEYGIDY